MNLEELLSARLAAAYLSVTGAPVDPVVRRSQHADFQSDAALPVARRLATSPRDLAARIVATANLQDLGTRAEVAGPGFVNLTVADDLLGARLSDVAADARLGVARVASPSTVVVDYSAPNVAKEMHVGHLRSTVIGDAAARLLEWLGHTVIRANHLGDWGTPFGMLIEHLVDVGESEAVRELSVGDLDGFYRAARASFDADPAFQVRARARVVALQAGDEETLRWWRLLVEQSQAYFLSVYDLLDVTLTAADFRGESAYNPLLASVVAELDGLGLLHDSDGAACAFPPGFTGRDGAALPIIVRKSDGGYGYGATDLAAIRHRIRDLHADRLLYVVGTPQKQHFEMVYAAARQAGWLAPPVTAVHVGFGSVLGADGKMLRTRGGGSVKLIGLLEEAVARAADLARAKNPELDESTVTAVARAVGIGAVKYADLSTDRGKDYVFDWEKMLALDGNTAPYLQYAYARIRSIFARAGLETVPGAAILVAHPAEHALALELLAFDPVVTEVAETLAFHRLAHHLHTVATTFSRFYEQCPVLKAEPAVRGSRLALCDLTGRILRQGLHLLGITTPERL